MPRASDTEVGGLWVRAAVDDINPAVPLRTSN